VLADMPVPSTDAERAQLDTHIAAALNSGKRGPQTVPGREVDEVLLVAGWFRKYPKELARTTPLEGA
jgi:hypothetical protein